MYSVQFLRNTPTQTLVICQSDIQQRYAEFLIIPLFNSNKIHPEIKTDRFCITMLLNVLACKYLYDVVISHIIDNVVW